MIKVFFDKDPLTKGHATRGIGYYTKNLYEQFQNNKDVELVEDENNADVIHRTYFDFFFNTLKIEKTPTVVTIYDTIPLIYPDHYPPGIRGSINFMKQKRELKKASAILTISETSKKDIVRFLDVPQEKIFPIYLAPAPFFRKMKAGAWENEIRKKYNLPRYFVLYVGDVNYNKNILALVEACLKINTPLVIIGKQAASEDFDVNHPENQELKSLIQKYGQNSQIKRLGFVPDEDLVKIYNCATVYCQPSLYEGFGLPVLEAFACGVPVVANKTQALVEIAQDNCLFSSTGKPEDLGKALKKVLFDYNLSRKLAKKDIEYSTFFSWKKTADETIKVYEKLI